jgi:uncharacterized integral membrane protein
MQIAQLFDATRFPLARLGAFGDYTITLRDYWQVVVYRGALMLMGLCFSAAAGLLLYHGPTAWTLEIGGYLFIAFSLAMLASIATIRIYIASLHYTLYLFWGIGGIAAAWVAGSSSDPFLMTVYREPLATLGVGFTFGALIGLFWKEAFCHHHIETFLLTPLVPILLIGHINGWFSVNLERTGLLLWALLFLVFILRKPWQEMEADIGDKTVMAHFRKRPLSSD